MKSEEVVRGYKFVEQNGASYNRTYNKRTKKRDIPCIWTLGKWKKQTGKLKLCSSGFHASTTIRDVLEYSSLGNRLFVVEAKGKMIMGGDKFVASQMRIVKEVKNHDKIVLMFAIASAHRKFDREKKKFGRIARTAIKEAEKLLRAKPMERNTRKFKKIYEELMEVNNEARWGIRFLLTAGEIYAEKDKEIRRTQYPLMELKREMFSIARNIAQKEAEAIPGMMSGALSQNHIDKIVDGLETKELEILYLLLASLVDKSTRGEL